jgi:hypothetical protein
MNKIIISIDETNDNAYDILKNNGVFYVNKYIKNEEFLDSLKSHVLKIIKSIDPNITKEFDNYYVESKNSYKNGSNALAKRNKTTFNFRGIVKNKINNKTYNYDNGFCDICKAELLFPEIKKLNLSYIFEICKKIKKNFNSENDIMYNIYYNNSVTDTRTWHRDGNIIKFFIYLEDVSLEKGPYSYIINSNDMKIELDKNNDISNEKINKILEKKSLYKKILFIGKKGDLICSNQNGIHRGQPQLKGENRLLLVIRLHNI